MAVDALFRQAGVIRVDTLEDLFDAAQVLAHQPLPPGPRVAIVSNGGGPAILAADVCAGSGLEVPELTSATQSALRGFVSRDAGVRNPIDLVPSTTADTYERALRTVLADEQIDAVLVIFVPPLVTQPDGSRARSELPPATRGRSRWWGASSDAAGSLMPCTRPKPTSGPFRLSLFPSPPSRRSGTRPATLHGADDLMARLPIFPTWTPSAHEPLSRTSR